MTIELNRQTEQIISRLEYAGYEAFAVGGCVRDCILGREVTDFDITTSALPEETKAVFSQFPVIETGIKHGTVTVLIDSIPFEITTYRTESGYTDSRHPDSVSFVRCLTEDLARRDFTVNAIAYSPKSGIVDPFGGISDIKTKVIRAVGEPIKRFSEDALRILRALRFASVIGFTVEENTSDAIFSLAESVNKVSPERIYTELKKLICGKNSAYVIKNYLSVLAEIIPINGAPESVELLPTDFSMRFAALCGKAVKGALVRLRADNSTRQLCEVLINSAPIPTDEIELKHYISALGRDKALFVAAYRRALYSEDISCLTEQIVSSEQCLSVKELKIDGNDLMSLGIEGQAIGKTLSFLLDAVIDGKVENSKELLLEKAK